MKKHWAWRFRSSRAWRRYWRFLWREAFAKWRKKGRSSRKQAIREIEKDFSDENIERQLSRDCFDSYHDIGYF